LGSVKRAAAELMNRHRDIPGIQAYRYASGLSQDQAAVRYNEVAEHQTSLGGTTINAWETWARGRGAGSPPPFSSLLILAIAHGRGPLGVTDEDISPGDLVSEAYERLAPDAPEDQLSLKRFGASRQPAQRTDSMKVHSPSVFLSSSTTSENSIGRDFNIAVPTVDNGNPAIRAFSLPNPQPGQLLDLTWEMFGFGIERLIRQIKNLGRRLDVDICSASTKLAWSWQRSWPQRGSDAAPSGI
jgi:transcriptional regulator with XRE-family HTH domain